MSVHTSASGATRLAGCLKQRIPIRTKRIGVSAMTKLKTSMLFLAFSDLFLHARRVSERGENKKAASPSGEAFFVLAKIASVAIIAKIAKIATLAIVAIISDAAIAAGR